MRRINDEPLRHDILRELLAQPRIFTPRSSVTERSATNLGDDLPEERSSSWEEAWIDLGGEG
jgi:hypothetical protein